MYQAERDCSRCQRVITASNYFSHQTICPEVDDHFLCSVWCVFCAWQHPVPYDSEANIAEKEQGEAEHAQSASVAEA